MLIHLNTYVMGLCGNSFTLTVLGTALDVRICRPQSKVDPRAVRVNTLTASVRNSQFNRLIYVIALAII